MIDVGAADVLIMTLFAVALTLLLCPVAWVISQYVTTAQATHSCSRCRRRWYRSAVPHSSPPLHDAVAEKRVDSHLVTGAEDGAGPVVRIVRWRTRGFRISVDAS